MARNATYNDAWDMYVPEKFDDEEIEVIMVGHVDDEKTEKILEDLQHEHFAAQKQTDNEHADISRTMIHRQEVVKTKWLNIINDGSIVNRYMFWVDHLHIDFDEDGEIDEDELIDIFLYYDKSKDYVVAGFLGNPKDRAKEVMAHYIDTELHDRLKLSDDDFLYEYTNGDEFAEEEEAEEETDEE